MTVVVVLFVAVCASEWIMEVPARRKRRRLHTDYERVASLNVFEDDPNPKSAIVCHPNHEECQLCGGWMHSGEPPEVPVGQPGLGDGRYCSNECVEEAVTAGWYDPERAVNATEGGTQ